MSPTPTAEAGERKPRIVEEKRDEKRVEKKDEKAEDNEKKRK